MLVYKGAQQRENMTKWPIWLALNFTLVLNIVIIKSFHRQPVEFNTSEDVNPGQIDV